MGNLSHKIVRERFSLGQYVEGVTEVIEKSAGRG
jgi:hypothetical protein